VKFCGTCGYVEVAPTGTCRSCGRLVGPQKRAAPYRDPVAVIGWIVVGAIVLALVIYKTLIAWVGSQL
jgi:hypothetical protein